ncbi:MAG TPA: acyl carrier protein [Flavipsychrobacter sp.]|nr:acyl carrier protein [Flavipsychrobacter sp.]
MDKNEILVRVNEIFKKELDNEDIKLDFESTAKDVEEWDSLSHVQLIVAIEKSFKIRFASREIQSWQNVGQMVETIFKKL